MDLHWARLERRSRLLDNPKRLQRHEHGCGACQEGQPGGCLETRVERHPAGGEDDFSLLAYLAYVLYHPLYSAGPISTFNSWLSYVRTPAEGGVYSRTARGIVGQVVLYRVALELMLWLVMPFALSRTPEVVAKLSLWEVSALGTSVLFAMYRTG